MKITIDITDRELLDLDLAITERRMNLNKQLAEVDSDQLKYIKNADIPASKACHRQHVQIIDEDQSLNNILTKIYDAVDQAYKSESLN